MKTKIKNAGYSAIMEANGTTEDKGLKAQIEERLTHKAELKRDFIKNGGINIVYILTSEDYTCGIRCFSGKSVPSCVRLSVATGLTDKTTYGS